MDDFNLTLSKGESMKVYSPQKIAGRHEYINMFIWNENEGKTSFSISGNDDDSDQISVKVVKGEIFIKTKHDIKLSKDEHGFTRGEIIYK